LVLSRHHVDIGQSFTRTRTRELAAWLSGSAPDPVGTGMGDRLCDQATQANELPTQPSILGGTENEYRPKCGDALRLGSKGRMAHSTCR